MLCRSLFSQHFVAATITLAILTVGCDQNSEPVAEKPAPEVKQEEPEKRPNLVKRKTKTVLNYEAALKENPNLVETVNRVQGSDPLSTALTGYIAGSSQINVMGMQHQIDLMEAAEGNKPTYDELMQVMQENNMELNALPDYQQYAYNETTGKFLVLEDPEAKKEFQEKAKR